MRSGDEPGREPGRGEADEPARGRPDRFHPEVTDGLPDSARRFLLRAIEPETPLATSVELAMRGEIRLAPDRDPVPFVARQVLAPPDAFVWRARTTGGLLRIRGYDRYHDGTGEMRWKLWGLIPVMRAAGPDVTRSAAGRLGMEAILLPSALAPGRVEWEHVARGRGESEPVDKSRARYRMQVGEETVEPILTVDPEGRPLHASAMRWSERAGPGYEPFDVEMEGELRAGGYTVPSRITAGWSFGREEEFRFFRATLERATFR